MTPDHPRSEDGALSPSLLNRTLSDIFDNCAGGSIAALDANSLMVSVDDVPSGLVCGCVCLVCRRPLVAKKGKIQAHHFAHKAGEFDPDCERAGETLLHRYAKEVLSREKRILLPPLTVSDRWGSLEVSPQQMVAFDSVELERRFGSVVPDVVGHLRSRDLFIEFLVTHRCSPEKLAKLKKLDVGVLEVDLSSYRSFRLSELDDIIVATAPRELLQSRAMGKASAMLAARAVAIKGSMESRLSDYLLTMSARTSGVTHTTMWYDIMDRHERTIISSHDDGSLHFFAVPAREWKSWALFELRRREEVLPSALVKFMPPHFFVSGYADLDPNLASFAVEFKAISLVTPAQAIQTFLSFCVRHGLAEYSDNGCYKSVIDWQRDPDVFERSITLTTAILRRAGRDPSLFDHFGWFGDICRRRGSEGRKHLLLAERRRLEDDLLALSGQVFLNGSMPEDDLFISRHVGN